MTGRTADTALPVRLVCATRLNQAQFFAQSLLGQSLKMIRKTEHIELMLFVENQAGLPSVYNKAIALSRQNPAILVFIHDDVLVPDLFFSRQIRAGLDRFDLIGVAGNTRRSPGQPAWLFKDIQLTWDWPHLSGAIAHGNALPPTNVSYYGPTATSVKLLDGVLLAVSSHTLHAHELQFDERFAFHFYDMDLCRQAEAAGLSMGTWPITLIHGSGGKFGGDPWRAGYASYMAKWQA